MGVWRPQLNQTMESNSKAIEGRSSAHCSASSLARKFHDTYERLAPQFGYETRIGTKTFDPASPNGKLMAAVCAEVVEPIREGLYDEMWRIMKQRDDLRKALVYIAHSGISGRHKEDVANEALSSQNVDVLAPAARPLPMHRQCAILPIGELRKMEAVVEAAKCIRHWHDRDGGGMVVSSEHVRKLWAALHDLEANAEHTHGANNH